MPAIAISASTLSDGLAAIVAEASVAPVPNAGNAGSNGFLALLQAADTQIDTPNGSSPASGQPHGGNNPPAQNTPVTPANISASDSSGASSENAPAKPNNDAAGSANNANNNSVANNAPQPKAQQSQSSSQPPSSAAAPTQKPPANQDAQSGNTQPTPDELRRKLSQQLSAINQILAGLLQAMTGTAPVVPVPPAAAPQSGTNTTGDNSQPVSSPADATSLLKDMQSLIDQLQQMLQPVGEGEVAAPAPDAAQAQIQDQLQTQTQGQAPGQTDSMLQQIIDALQTDSATLTQMLKAQNTGNGLAGVSEGSLLNASVLPPPDTTALVSSIAQVKNQLQQLQAANNAQLLKAQADFQAQFAQSLSAFTGTTNAAATQNSDATAGGARGANNANGNTPTPPVAPAIIPLSATNAPAGTIMVAPVIAGQGGTGSSAGDGSSDGQSQPMPIPSVAAGPSAPAGNVATISFVKVLDQASATSSSSLLDQVTFNVKTALDGGSSKIHIQLDPADLGKLDIQINIGADGKTGVAITADNKNTLAMLQRDTTGLMRALSDAGLSTSSGSLSFSLGGGQQQFAGGQQPPASQAAATYQSTQPQEEDTGLPVISQTYVIGLAQGLDITI